MVFAGFQNTAACGLVARNPESVVTNFTGPGASGSVALVLRSMRIFQPRGTGDADSGPGADCVNTMIHKRLVISTATNPVRSAESDTTLTSARRLSQPRAHPVRQKASENQRKGRGTARVP